VEARHQREDQEADMLVRAPIVAKGRSGAIAPPIVREVLRTPGLPLEPGVRGYMESRFGRDLSQIRVHADPRAAQAARAVGALGFAVGTRAVFGAGAYSPATNRGRNLIAHELAHATQQAAPAPTAPLRIAPEQSRSEREAEDVAAAAAQGRAHGRPAPAPTECGLHRATRTFALTFDDGPHTAALGKGTNLTEKVLDTLKAKGVPAGFFIQTGVSYRGANAVGRQLVARMAADGHAVGIHTGGSIDHELHTKAEAKGTLASELAAASSYISKETGSAPTMVRPPTGKSNTAVATTYKKLGLTNLLWDMDGDQGKNLAVPDLKGRIRSEMAGVQKRGWKPSTPSPNIVVLYHDIQKNTANNLDDLIEHIKKTTVKLSGGADTASFAAP
jgi:peptidoglycan/xylan/chitin deacetylase (PgdA/CDA1 family)